ncbi:hypothetical protein Clacol_002588 [Clathrus columnatus]|uniref:Nucleoporin p58/p45 n=1 Tax=Clathrus columnatus TaxID=1419009 RepID=A0AAV5A559_9AGAM|nr:hypothetical protein Clacol_002588 [Clathrus columnatus]
MAFASSSADFGIRSSAPAQAQAFSEKQNPPSLFGGGQSTFGQNTVQPNTSNSIFGQPPQQPANSGINTFGSWGNNSVNNANTGTTWGQAAGQNQSQQTSALGGNAFGNPTQQQQPSQPSIFGGGSGAFGHTNVQQNQNQGSGLFGSNNNQNQTQQPMGSSIFGNSLFGANTQQQQQQQPSTNGTSLFIPKSTFGSSFGNANPVPQPPTSSLWANPLTSNNVQSSFTQSLAGSSIQAQQQSAPLFTRTTRFNDLPETVQKVFETIDTHIQGRIQISRALKSRSLADEPTKAAETLRRAHNDLLNTVSSQQSDRTVVEEIRSKVDQCVQDTIITTRIIDGFKNPQQNGTYLKNHVTFPLEYADELYRAALSLKIYFIRAAENIRHKLLWYKSTIEAQNKSFLALAAKTAELDTELQKLKNEYRELWKAHTGSARDPFNELDRRPGDSEGLLNGIGSFNLNR